MLQSSQRAVHRHVLMFRLVISFDYYCAYVSFDKCVINCIRCLIGVCLICCSALRVCCVVCDIVWRCVLFVMMSAFVSLFYYYRVVAISIWVVLFLIVCNADWVAYMLLIDLWVFLFLHVLCVSVMLLAQRGREDAGAPLAQRGRGTETNHRACGAARADVGEIVTAIHLYGKSVTAPHWYRKLNKNIDSSTLSWNSIEKMKFMNLRTIIRKNK